MIKAVIFDFGGVLVRTGDPAGRREWETRLGLAGGELERAIHGSKLWIDAQLGLISPDDYWTQTAASLHLTEADLPALRHDYFRDDRLDRDLVGLIDALRLAGFKVGLLSNDALALENKLRHEFAIYDHFDALIISAQIGVMKPDLGAYQAIAQALGVEPDQCVFIDDNAANVEGARRVGMYAIQYRADMDLHGTLAPLIGKRL